MPAMYVARLLPVRGQPNEEDVDGDAIEECNGFLPTHALAWISHDTDFLDRWGDAMAAYTCLRAHRGFTIGDVGFNFDHMRLMLVDADHNTDEFWNELMPEMLGNRLERFRQEGPYADNRSWFRAAPAYDSRGAEWYDEEEEFWGDLSFNWSDSLQVMAGNWQIMVSHHHFTYISPPIEHPTRGIIVNRTLRGI